MSTADAPLPAAPKIAGSAPHLLIVRAPYYRAVLDGMTAGAERILRAAGASFEIADVAGSFELAQAIRLVLRGAPAQKSFDGFVALGCIVRGGTDHYDYICRETIAGLMQVALQFGICLGSGVLTVQSLEQAVARSGQDGHNKGAEAAVAALLQISTARRFAGNGS
jgi:6,7-dimethyl-8-ribityllumazine synthase